MLSNSQAIRNIWRKEQSKTRRTDRPTRPVYRQINGGRMKRYDDRSHRQRATTNHQRASKAPIVPAWLQQTHYRKRTTASYSASFSQATSLSARADRALNEVFTHTGMPFGSLLSATAGGRQTGGVDLKLSEIVHRYTQKLFFFEKVAKKVF